MIKHVSILGLATLISSGALACELPKGEVLTVGCSSECDFIYRARLKMNAWSLGYSTKIINLKDAIDPKAALAEADAVLLPGGADIDPAFYLETIKPELKNYTTKNLSLVNYSKEGEERDAFEHSLVKLYSSDEQYKNLPMLGICRGLQMMAVAQGIPLYLDIDKELGIPNRVNQFDKIELVKDEKSLMSEIYQEEIKGFKIHHQGIRVPYYQEHQSEFPLTKITAFSHDNKIAEAIEYTHRPALGVQFHPERSFTSASSPVFKWFLTKACEYKNSTKGKI